MSHLNIPLHDRSINTVRDRSENEDIIFDELTPAEQFFELSKKVNVIRHEEHGGWKPPLFQTKPQRTCMEVEEIKEHEKNKIKAYHSVFENMFRSQLPLERLQKVLQSLSVGDLGTIQLRVKETRLPHQIARDNMYSIDDKVLIEQYKVDLKNRLDDLNHFIALKNQQSMKSNVVLSKGLEMLRTQSLTSKRFIHDLERISSLYTILVPPVKSLKRSSRLESSKNDILHQNSTDLFVNQLPTLSYSPLYPMTFSSNTYIQFRSLLFSLTTPFANAKNEPDQANAHAKLLQTNIARDYSGGVDIGLQGYLVNLHIDNTRHHLLKKYREISSQILSHNSSVKSADMKLMIDNQYNLQKKNYNVDSGVVWTSQRWKLVASLMLEEQKHILSLALMDRIIFESSCYRLGVDTPYGNIIGNCTINLTNNVVVINVGSSQGTININIKVIQGQGGVAIDVEEVWKSKLVLESIREKTEKKKNEQKSRNLTFDGNFDVMDENEESVGVKMYKKAISSKITSSPLLSLPLHRLFLEYNEIIHSELHTTPISDKILDSSSSYFCQYVHGVNSPESFVNRDSFSDTNILPKSNITWNCNWVRRKNDWALKMIEYKNITQRSHAEKNSKSDICLLGKTSSTKSHELLDIEVNSPISHTLTSNMSNFSSHTYMLRNKLPNNSNTNTNSLNIWNNHADNPYEPTYYPDNSISASTLDNYLQDKNTPHGIQVTNTFTPKYQPNEYLTRNVARNFRTNSHVWFLPHIIAHTLFSRSHLALQLYSTTIALPILKKINHKMRFSTGYMLRLDMNLNDNDFGLMVNLTLKRKVCEVNIWSGILDGAMCFSEGNKMDIITFIECLDERLQSFNINDYRS